MTDKYLVEPDIGFITEIAGLGGQDLKKCFQCATCSVACPISPENKPFPRKEMIAASWGLKDRLVGNGDIWLCHQCGDCTTLCPRGAKPGDVLGAIRAYAISEYAEPKFLAKAVNSPAKLPLLLGFPAVWFALLACITMFAGDAMESLFGAVGLHSLGQHWYHGPHGPGAPIAHAQFVSTWLIDSTFVPLATIVAILFIRGLSKFLTAVHENAVLEGKTDKPDFQLKDVLSADFGKALLSTIVTILKHQKFNECSENKARTTSHMMVLYGFIGCAIVTGTCVILIYLFHAPGPYSQLTPLKWLANVAGISIVIGAFLMIKERLTKEGAVNAYKDWFLLGLVLALGLTGLLAEMTRLAGMANVTFFIYWLHLISVFTLFAYLPFSKMAHIVYRTFALTYMEYAGRK
jgi:quinone-modifying oxidoreductase subunit QmoC